MSNIPELPKPSNAADEEKPFNFGIGATTMNSTSNAVLAGQGVFNFGSSEMPILNAVEEEDDEEFTPFEMTGEVLALTAVQDEYAALMLDMGREMREVLKKYEPIVKKTLKARKDIISGEAEVPSLENIDEQSSPSNETIKSKGIEDFWLTCFMNCQLYNIVDKGDVEALQKLVDVTTELLPENEDGSNVGFKTNLHFAENEFFENDVLSISLFIPNFPIGDQVDDVEVTPIVWKEGRDLTQSMSSLSNESTPKSSFFRIFHKIEIPESLLNAEVLEESDMELMEGAMMIKDLVTSVAFILREKLLPNAVNWYTGEAEDEEDDSYAMEGPGEKPSTCTKGCC